MSKEPIYSSWLAMKRRCINTNNPRYADYGGRGIKICERWVDSFEKFFEDMGDTYSSGLELDRIDVNGDYEPSNCRWVTPQQNNWNTRVRKGECK